MKEISYIEKPFFLYNDEVVQHEVDYVKIYPNGNMYYYFNIDGEELCKFPEFIFKTKEEVELL